LKKDYKSLGFYSLFMVDLEKREKIGEAIAKKTGKSIVAGWVHEKRDLGGIKFITLRDATGFLQVTILKKKCDKGILDMFEEITKESIIIIKGEMKENSQAPDGVEFLPEEMETIALSEQPVPIDLSGKITTSLDKRLDWRWLDMRDPKVLAIFRLESNLIKYFNEYFQNNGFTRIFTSKIVSAPTEGGTEYFTIKYFDREAFLAQSPQFYKESVLASGLDRVYDIGMVYRAEPHHTTRHLCEYASIDFEIAFIKSQEDVMKEEERLIKYVIEKIRENDMDILKMFGAELPSAKIPFPRVTLEEGKEIVKKMGVTPEEGDLTSAGEVALGEWAKKEHKCDFVFIKEFPWEKKPFYVMRKGDGYSESFDLLMRGLEITSGGQREHRYKELENNCKAKKLKIENFDHVRFYKYGMPPHGGMAIGLERFTQKLLNLGNVREATLLPRDPTRINP